MLNRLWFTCLWKTNEFCFTLCWTMTARVQVFKDNLSMMQFDFNGVLKFDIFLYTFVGLFFLESLTLSYVFWKCSWVISIAFSYEGLPLFWIIDIDHSYLFICIWWPLLWDCYYILMIQWFLYNIVEPSSINFPLSISGILVLPSASKLDLVMYTLFCLQLQVEKEWSSYICCLFISFVLWIFQFPQF